MDSNVVIIILCGLVICSYFFDFIAKKTRLPSVILLLGSGIGLRLIADSFGFFPSMLIDLLPVLGTMGLILIVLEGSLELRFDSDRLPLIGSSFASAAAILVITTLTIGLGMYYIEGVSMRIAFINAIPLGVISSAIAIPSVSSLPRKKKEFIIYESSFSDIIGIIVFNFALRNASVDIGAFIGVGSDIILIGIISLICCSFILYLLRHISHHVKFFLLIAILVLVYAVGKLFHLPSLLTILIFGLVFNNLDKIRSAIFKRFFIYPELRSDIELLSKMTAESAFLLRTFFFLIFGFTVDLTSLTDVPMIVKGLAITAIIFSIRFVYLFFFRRDNLMPELFIAPRGLISILLFLSLPLTMQIGGYESGLIFFIVLVTSLIMSVGLIRWHKHHPAPTSVEKEIQIVPTV